MDTERNAGGSGVTVLSGGRGAAALVMDVKRVPTDLCSNIPSINSTLNRGTI
jgi:hypothetical protein